MITFAATKKLFTVKIDCASVISGRSNKAENRYATFYRPIPVKKGDQFKAAEGGVILNGEFVPRRARPYRKTVYKIPWVAKRMRVAIFQERDKIWNPRKKKFSRKFGKPYWVACDLKSYNLGTADTVVDAIKIMFELCNLHDFAAWEERQKGRRVIRYRVPLPKRELKDFERKAKKTGFILDGVEPPPFPRKWAKKIWRIKL